MTLLKFGMFAASLGALVASSASQAAQDPAWRGYAETLVKPQFSWANEARAAAPTSRDLAGDSIRSRLSLSISRSAAPMAFANIGSIEGIDSSNGRSRFDGFSRDLLQRDVVTSRLALALGRDTQLSVGAVLARQRFASPAIGVGPAEIFDGAPAGGFGQSDGTGAVLALDHRVNDKLSVSLGWQSRIDMDAFEGVRGVFHEAGDFDLPARARFDATWRLTPALRAGLGYERIFFSDVPTFSSTALPQRFLSLLGDGASPEFRWQDLDVLSASLAVDRDASSFELTWSTSQQPTPTSRMLARALDYDGADGHWTLAWTHQWKQDFAWRLSAAWSPYRYLAAGVPGPMDEPSSRSQLELEALFGFRF